MAAPRKVKIEPQNDLEESPISKSSCSLLTIFFILLLIFILVLGGLIYLKIKSPSIKLPENSLSANKNLNSKVEVETVKNSAGEEVLTIKITEADLKEGLKLNEQGFPLKKPEVKINSDKILLTGRTGDSFLSLGVEVGIVPKVESGKVKFNIIEIKSAGITAPKTVADTLNNGLGKFLDDLSALFGKIDVTEVKLDSGFLTATGKVK